MLAARHWPNCGNTVMSAGTGTDSIASSIPYWQVDSMIIPKKDQCKWSIPFLGLLFIDPVAD